MAFLHVWITFAGMCVLVQLFILNLILLGSVYLFDHGDYLPGIGLLLVFAGGLHRVLTTGRGKHGTKRR